MKLSALILLLASANATTLVQREIGSLDIQQGDDQLDVDAADLTKALSKEFDEATTTTSAAEVSSTATAVAEVASTATAATETLTTLATVTKKCFFDVEIAGEKKE